MGLQLLTSMTPEVEDLGVDSISAGVGKNSQVRERIIQFFKAHFTLRRSILLRGTERGLPRTPSLCI